MTGHSAERKNLNNRGSAMIMALTLLSLIAILGVMAMTTALLNLKMRDLNRRSDRNFYYLETALDEIYAQTGRMASDILKEEYENVVSHLYQDGYKTNEEANEKLREAFIDKLAAKLGGLTKDAGQDDTAAEVNKAKAAAALEAYSDTIHEEELGVSLESVTFTRQTESEGNLLAALSEGNDYTGLQMKGLCLVYVNPESGIESALTVDLNINAPYVRFMNEGDSLLDYVMAANGGINVNVGGTELPALHFAGKIYGGQITVDHAEVKAESGLFTAKGDLTVKNGAELTILPESETGAKSRVWADGIVVNFASVLTAENASFFVRDDLTLSGDQNKVTLSGNYYGYGNEGYESSIREARDKADRSSAILMNDKSSRLDLRGLDSLMLAGRAYLRFNTKGSAKSDYIYPMGESLAVRATQTMYLIPEEYISVESISGGINGGSSPAGSNPVLFKETEADALKITVTLPNAMGGKTAVYQVDAGFGAEGKAEKIEGSGEDGSPALLIVLRQQTDSGFMQKIYVYYNFDNENERTAYFTDYLNHNGTTFDSLLQKGGITGVESGGEQGKNGGIFLNDGGQITASGALYEVTGNAEGTNAHLFQLLRTRQDSPGSSLTWVELTQELKTSFDNLKENLVETNRVSGRLGNTVSGWEALLPIGNYVKLDEVAKLTKPLCNKGGDESGSDGNSDGNSDGKTHVFLSGKTVTVTVQDSGIAKVSSGGVTESVEGGLIVSSGDVEIRGSGKFSGLILAGGTIQIKGEVTLTADGQFYEPYLEEENIAPYFYDYSDVASTVLNDYEDFVTRENWIRAGREEKGGK